MRPWTAEGTAVSSAVSRSLRWGPGDLGNEEFGIVTEELLAVLGPTSTYRRRAA